MIDLKDMDIVVAVSEEECVHTGSTDHVLTQRKAACEGSQLLFGKCDPGDRDRHQITVQLIHNLAAVKAEIGIDQVFLIIVAGSADRSAHIAPAP